MPIHLYLVCQFLGYSVGTVLFLVLVGTAWRVDSVEGETRGWVWSALVGLWWNASNIINLVAIHFLGYPIGSRPETLSDLSAFCATAFFPPALLILIRQTRLRDARRLRVLSLFRSISIGVGLGLSGAMAGAKLISGLPVGFVTLTHAAGYNFAIQLGIGWFFFRDSELTSPFARVYARTMLFIGLLLVGLIVPLIFFRPDPALTRLLNVLSGQVTLPMAVASLVILAQFRYADLFVKRSLVVIAAVVTIALYQSWLVGPIQAAAGRVPFQPQALTFCLGVLLWAPLLLAFQEGAGRLNQGIDRFVFRRPDYARILNRWRQEIESLQTESEVIVLTQAILSEAFSTQSVDIRAGSIPGSTPAYPTVVIPVRIAPDDELFLVVAPGETGRPVLAEEARFLGTVGDTLGNRLSAIRILEMKRTQELREARLRETLMEAELRALRAQVNPHFLFNTLNTIADLIGSEPERAEAMTEKLAGIFRYALAGADKSLISIGEEFDFLKAYLEIEKARFGERLGVEFHLDPAFSEKKIPTLLLQPLVENAVKHGISPKLKGGTIRIGVSVEGEILRFAISDDGIGFEETGASAENGVESPADLRRSRAGNGIGLHNIRERLVRLFGERGRLNIDSRPGIGSTVVVEFPYENDRSHYRR